MSNAKQYYMDLLNSALRAFLRIDLDEYEQVTEDEESAEEVRDLLRHMIANVEEADDEKWGR